MLFRSGLSTTKEGNIKTLNAAIKIEKRKQETAALEREYRKQHNGRIDAGFNDYLAGWAKEHPLFGDAKKVSASDKPVSSPAIENLKKKYPQYTVEQLREKYNSQKKGQ